MHGNIISRKKNTNPSFEKISTKRFTKPLLWKISKLHSKYEGMLKQLRNIIHQVLHRILLKIGIIELIVSVFRVRRRSKTPSLSLSPSLCSERGSFSPFAASRDVNAKSELIAPLRMIFTVIGDRCTGC